MSLPAYGRYKESGLPWVGAIPQGWDVVPLLGVASERRESNKGIVEDNLLSLSYGRIVKKDMASNDGLLPDSFETYQVVHRGDIVFRLTDLQNDKRSLRTASATQKGIITSAYIAVVSRRIDSRYFGYLLRSYDLTKVFYSMGGGLRQSMKYDDVKRLPIIVPTQQEQAAISDFLDRETAKIDGLIAEQEKLLTLLAEKRQATISHAVTRGLDPNAPMKDSGMPWIGNVPAHWGVSQLRHVAQIVRGASPRPAGDPRYFAQDPDEDGTVPWLTVAEITKDDALYVEEVSDYLTALGAEQSQRFEKGVVVFSNSGATLGVPKILGIDCCANDGVVAFRELSDGLDSEYLYCFLLTTTLRLRTEMKQGGGQPNLNTSIVKDIGIACPPLTEQREILVYLRAEFRRFTELSRASEQSVSLLSERRSALIAAAVTGKIDVRGAA